MNNINFQPLKNFINLHTAENYGIHALQAIEPGLMFPTNIVSIPANITVHLGPPDEDAINVTVPFIDYIKNVASSELYPTWPENALRANIHAIVSVALNRIFTEWYRSRGYDFDITNSTQFDQAYVHNRGIFDSVSNIADEIFNQYIIREGRVEPLYALFCDGRVSQCNGLLQWGSVELANQGYAPIDILKYYFGENIALVTNAPVEDINTSYPGEPLKLGDSGFNVLRFQHSLDRISNNYPAIPKVPLNGYFDETTEKAVSEFQRIFKLPVTGIVDQGTWYRIRYIYVAVTKLAELSSEGLPASEIENLYSGLTLEGDKRPRVNILQYFLNVLSAYYKSIPEIPITGFFGPETREAVIAFQKVMGLPETGVVNSETWDALFNNVLSILNTLPPESVYLPIFRYPGNDLKLGDKFSSVLMAQEMLSYISLIIPSIPHIEPNGTFDEATRNAVIAFQSLEGLNPTGVINEETWNRLEEVYRSQRFSGMRSVGTFPGQI